MNFPSEIENAIAQWLALRGKGGRNAGTRALTERYAMGGTSAAADVASYLVARAPATYAAVRRALELTTEVHATLAPKSMLDVGAGPGTAIWAAHDTFNSLSDVTGLDANPDFIAVAKQIAEISGQTSTFIEANLTKVTFPKADLVLASYVLAELSLHEVATHITKLFEASNDTVLIVEPGTKHGFERIALARQTLIKLGAHILAPCTHNMICPMTGGNWCHFKERLARSRAHMHAKSATVPFEDEPFSFIAAARRPIATNGARLVSPPRCNKVAATLPVCNVLGLSELSIASRDKPLYKRAKSMRWGDRWPDEK